MVLKKFGRNTAILLVQEQDSVGMNALTSGGSDKEGEKKPLGQGTKDDPVILQRNPDGSLTQGSKER